MKTVIGAFETSNLAERAALDLVNAGILRDDISVIANNEGGRYAPYSETVPEGTTITGHAVGHDAKVGAEWGAGIGFVVGLTGLAIPGLGWIATSGWLLGTLLGAGTGAVVGGLVGALTHVGVPEAEAMNYNEAVKYGNVLVAVRAQEADAPRIAQILESDGAVDVADRAALYQQANYSNSALNNSTLRSEGNIPGIQTGGRAYDGTPDTRGITEKIADTVTGNRIDDKTGKPVA